MNRSTEGSELVFDARFRSFFGISAVVCTVVWKMLLEDDLLPEDAVASYLLWALMFLKTYNTESVLAGIAGGVDEQTYQKWTWIFIDCIVALEVKVVSVLLQSLFLIITVY